MPDEEWTSFSQILSWTAHSGIRKAANKEEPLSHGNLTLDSMRFAYLIASRGIDKCGQAAFLKHFRAYEGSSPRFLEFKQGWALNCALIEAIPWGEALKIARDTYREGIEASEFDLPIRNSPLSTEVYSEILSNPTSYPVFLYDAAEIAATRAMRKAVKAVSSIARSDRWFSFDA
jgi:hypothetical protein